MIGMLFYTVNISVMLNRGGAEMAIIKDLRSL